MGKTITLWQAGTGKTDSALPGLDPPGPFQDLVAIPAGQTVSPAFTGGNPGLWDLHSLVVDRADFSLLCTLKVVD